MIFKNLFLINHSISHKPIIAMWLKFTLRLRVALILHYKNG